MSQGWEIHRPRSCVGYYYDNLLFLHHLITEKNKNMNMSTKYIGSSMDVYYNVMYIHASSYKYFKGF